MWLIGAGCTSVTDRKTDHNIVAFVAIGSVALKHKNAHGI